MRAGLAVFRHAQGPLVFAPYLRVPLDGLDTVIYRAGAGFDVAQVAVDAAGLRAVAMRGETPLAQLLPCWTGTAQDDDRPAVPFWRAEHEAALQGLAEWFGWTASDTQGTVYATPGGEAAEPLAVLYREPGCSTMFELGMAGIPGVNAAVHAALRAA